jgi:heme/copper-type cytochrome/quinol oxidase subunit 2
MKLKSRTSSLLFVGVVGLLSPFALQLFAHPSTSSPLDVARGNSEPVEESSPDPAQGQEQAPNRREITLTARNYRFSPNRIEVAQDDLVKLTVQSEDVAYSLTIDEYRVSRRIPAGGSTTLEFRADRPGTFAFYSNMTNDARHSQMRGELVVRSR